MFLFPLNKIKVGLEKQQVGSDHLRCVDHVLNNNFPLGMYIFNFVFVITIALALIVLQVISIIYRSPFYYIGAG
jgi:hypothetical protein